MMLIKIFSILTAFSSYYAVVAGGMMKEIVENEASLVPPLETRPSEEEMHDETMNYAGNTANAAAGGGLRGAANNERKLGGGYLHRGWCCNYSGSTQWVLLAVNDGPCYWLEIPNTVCLGGRHSTTDPLLDCEGMTCGGGFYKVRGILGHTCENPASEERRWTPQGCGPGAYRPRHLCPGGLNPALPPGYTWGPHPNTTCAPTAAPTPAPTPPHSSGRTPAPAPVAVMPKVTSPPDYTTANDYVAPPPADYTMPHVTSPPEQDFLVEDYNYPPPPASGEDNYSATALDSSTP